LNECSFKILFAIAFNDAQVYGQCEIQTTHVHRMKAYTELDVLNRHGVLLKCRFCKRINKLETFVPSNRTYIIETGNGLTYRISRSAKGKKRNPEDQEI